MRHREAGLFLFASVILAASLLTETRRDGIAASPNAADAARSTPRARPDREVLALDADAWLERLRTRSMNAAPGGQGFFGGTTWQPPAPAAALPAKPATPPFPFRLLGRMTVAGATVVVLAKGEQTFPVKAGAVVEQFRIDKFDDEVLSVTYVPNGEKRDFRYEELYPVVTAAATPFGPSPADAAATPATMPAQQAPSPPREQERTAGDASAATGAAGPAPGSMTRAAAGTPTSAPEMPFNQVPGASAPIGGMMVTPSPPGSEMQILQTAPGAGMVMVPVPSGATMPGMQATPSGSSSAPGRP